MQQKDKMEWWRRARFGLFVHWGLYAELGGQWKGQEMDYIGEWTQSRFQIPIAEMEQVATRFNPSRFDADEWVKLAKDAGMRYIMFTAKHHEGFAMYHSKCDRYNIVDATPFGRDVLRELAEACARQGVTLCLYYSHALDWHEKDAGGTEPDMMKNFGMSWGNDWDFPDHDEKNFDRYFKKKVIPQLTELLTGYGPIGAIFFDTPMGIEERHCLEIAELVSSLQPDCLTNTRLGFGLGDIKTLGDNQVPSCPIGGNYECISTINDTWGYKVNDKNFKSSREILGEWPKACLKEINYGKGNFAAIMRLSPALFSRAKAVVSLNEHSDYRLHCF